MKVVLLGKRYEDRIFTLNILNVGETNVCSSYKERRGGAYNLVDANVDGIDFVPIIRGSKAAFVINDRASSARTSIVLNNEPSMYDSEDLKSLNDDCDWVHVSYIDDIEQYDVLLNIPHPISIDFCTVKPREEFIDIIKKAEIVFDSRERRFLYSNLRIATPIILHDENGTEIMQSGITTATIDMTPVDNLEVNGAGDVYAANFIKNYKIYGIIKAAKIAMSNTTKFLIERNP